MPLAMLLIGIGLIVLGSVLYPIIGFCALFASFAGGYLFASGLIELGRSR